MSWATCTLGHAHWGPRGAAGLLLAQGRVLLQLRARWAHQGGTWSIPGGARERGESMVEAALREASEELGLDPDGVETARLLRRRVRRLALRDGLRQPRRARSRITDNAESAGHRWVDADEVDDLELHPAFREAWTAHRRCGSSCSAPYHRA